MLIMPLPPEKPGGGVPAGKETDQEHEAAGEQQRAAAEYGGAGDPVDQGDPANSVGCALALAGEAVDLELDEAVEKSYEEKGGYEDKLYLSWSSDTEYSSQDQGHGFDD